jgi:peptidoglycan hydrolase CwlO-like protein
MFLLRAVVVLGQQDDPSDIFLNAYLSGQQGEKLEHQDRFKTALAKYRFAGSLIEELRKSHADWQPAIVEYRGRKISEAILRLQERVTRRTRLNASASPLPDIAAAAPESDAWSEPGPEALVAPSEQAVTEESHDSATKLATKKVRNKLADLQEVLDKTHNDLENTRKEKEVLNTRLRQTSSELERARNDLTDAKKSEHQARDQLAQLQEGITASARIDHTAQEQLNSEAAQSKQAVAEADQARVTAENERDDAQRKFAEANHQTLMLECERDDALSQLKFAKEAQGRFESLSVEKDDLQQRLGIAEKEVCELREGRSKATGELATMKRQIAQLRQELIESQNRNDYLAARAAELDVELEDTGTELQAARLADANTADAPQLARENELLRNIVIRERQEEMRRNDAWKVVWSELDRLKVRSELLNKQIEFLAEPISNLTVDEIALFRQPVISMSNEKTGGIRMNFVFEKKSPPVVRRSADR